MLDKKLPSSVLRSKVNSALTAFASFSTYSDEPTSRILSGFEKKFGNNHLDDMSQQDLAMAHAWLIEEHQRTRENLLEWKRQPGQDNPLIDDYLGICDIATPHRVQPFVTEIARAGIASPQICWIKYFKKPAVACITPFGIWMRENFPRL